MIGTFIKIEDIQVFLDKFHIDSNIDEESKFFWFLKDIQNFHSGKSI